MRGQFANESKLVDAIRTNDELRNEIEALSEHFLGRKVSGCPRCYGDAYIQLIHLSKTKIMVIENCKFHLRAGALLRDVENFDTSKNMTNANISNDLALYHLRTNPSCRELFDALPDNVDELIAQEQEGTASPSAGDTQEQDNADDSAEETERKAPTPKCTKK